MLTFVICVVALRVVLSVARCAWAVILRVGHLEWTKVKQDFSLEPRVAVLVPCFNEGPAVREAIRSILECEYPADKLEVVAVDDGSCDDSFSWIEQAATDFPGRVIAGRNLRNIGKSRTLIAAAKLTSSDIIVVVDSDCTFSGDTIRQLVSCFASPTMGIVGGKLGVRNPNINSLTQVQTFVYYLAFDLWKTFENWTRSVTCVGGYLFAIRRQLFEQIEPEILSRKWFGVEITEGEDRFITHKALLLGYDTYVNVDVKCWTVAPHKYTQFFKQQYRWRKSGIRDLFLTYRLLPKHLGVVHPNAIYSQTVAPLTSLVFTLAVIAAPFFSPLFWLNPASLAAAVAVAAILHGIIGRDCPNQQVRNPLVFALFGLWWIVNSFYLTILCLLTFDFSDWGSRTKASQGAAEVVRDVAIGESSLAPGLIARTPTT